MDTLSMRNCYPSVGPARRVILALRAGEVMWIARYRESGCLR